MRLHARAVEDSHNILVKALRGHDEIAPVELAERIARAAVDGIILRQHSVHQVIAQVDPLIAALLFLAADEDDVHLSLRQQLVGAVDMIRHANIHVHVRPLLTEAADNARQPVHGHAGKRADADHLAA